MNRPTIYTTDRPLKVVPTRALVATLGTKPAPYCNTGGYEVSKENNQLEKPAFNNQDSITALDWLRLTTNDLKSYRETMGELTTSLEPGVVAQDDQCTGILEEAGMQVHWTEKGLHGYDTSASIKIWRDNDYLTVGHIAYSEGGRNKGGLFELTGVGCKVLQLEYPALWLELYNVLMLAEWRISRVDIALDLSGDYAKEHGYTVPLLFKQAKTEGLFKSDSQRNPLMKQTFKPEGDWTPLLFEGVTPETYDPLKDCPAGLTAYIGNRKSSDDFFRIYEKGKQLLGAMAEPESVDRGWIRIEHEMSRKATGRTIPLDVMLRPDEYFCAGRSHVRFIMEQLRAHRDLQAIQSWQRAQFKREKGLLLSKKVHWARHTYGRLLRTLQDKGFSDSEIIDKLSRTSGLKEFVFDLVEEATPAEMMLKEAA
ncbi:replication initiation factor domain-containing protein [Thiothrix eikelboomii]|uniref:replication initiation factor domain-containing protein n=1 Tax=Thiothrix eikelboomii TaxID=92487 RepID=UPI003BAFB1E1